MLYWNPFAEVTVLSSAGSEVSVLGASVSSEMAFRGKADSSMVADRSAASVRLNSFMMYASKVECAQKFKKKP